MSHSRLLDRGCLRGGERCGGTASSTTRRKVPHARPGRSLPGGPRSRGGVAPAAAPVLGAPPALARNVAVLRLRPVASSTAAAAAKSAGEGPEAPWRAAAGDSSVEVNKEAPFEWKSNWYAVGVPANLDPSRPHPVTVLGRNVVLWRDPHLHTLMEEEGMAGEEGPSSPLLEGGGKGALGGAGSHSPSPDPSPGSRPRPKTAWRCFLDRCPHRLVPLSEGRIDERGQLQCSYHGWTFSGEGACTGIPQAAKQGPEHGAGKSARACATPLPITEERGILFVWPDEGPEAFSRALATPPPMPAGIDSLYSLGQFSRELPYGYEMLAENVMDPAHLPFAHHGVGPLRRSLGQPFPVVGIVPGTEGARGFVGRLLDPSLPHFSPVHFQAPGLYANHMSLRHARGMASSSRPGQGSPSLDCVEETTLDDAARGTAGPMFVTALFLTPVAPGRCRVTVMEASSRPPRGLLSSIRQQHLWLYHLFAQNFLDGDAYLLHVQGKVVEGMKAGQSGLPGAVGKRGPAPGTAPAAAPSAYFLPTSADRFVIAFWRWFDSFGGGQVPFPEEYATARLSPDWAPKTEALDRYASHTAHCKSCQDALAGFCRAQKVAAAAAVMMLVVAANLKAELHAVARAALLLLSVAGAVLTIGFQKVIDQFKFTGYDHATR